MAFNVKSIDLISEQVLFYRFIFVFLILGREIHVVFMQGACQSLLGYFYMMVLLGCFSPFKL